MDEKADEIYKDSNLLLSKIHPDDIGRLMAAIAVSTKKREPLTIIYRTKIKNGNYIWVRSDSIPALQEDGSVLRNGSIIDITEAQEAEEKLRESEIKFKSLVENIHESLIIEDTEGRLVYCNSEFGKMFGYTEEEMKNLNFKDYTSKESYDEVAERHAKRMKGIKVPEEFEYKGRRKDGREIWIECRVSTLVEGGKIVGTQSLEKDITDRKLAEEKLKESEGKYRTLMQQAGDLIVLFNSSGLIIEANETARQILGYKEEEFKNLPLKDFFFNDDLKNNPLKLDELGKGLSTISRRKVKRKDGGVLELEIHSRMLPDGNFIGVGRDLTERIKAEQLLRESEEKYRSIVEKNLAGIYQTTTKGKILTCNNAFAQMLGYTVEFLKQQDATILYFSKADRKQFLTRLQKNGEIVNHETVLKHKNGDPVYIVEICSLLKDTVSGEDVIEGVLIDITERKKAEQALSESEQRYRSLVEQASDGILVADFQGDIIEVNTALCVMFGYTKEEVLLKKISSFLDPIDLKQNPIRFDLLRSDRTRLVERRALHKDGYLFDIELSSKLIGEGRVLSIIRDISERKKAEKALVESEIKHRTIVDTTDEMMQRLSADGKIVWVNESWKKNMGYPEKEVISKNLNDFLNDKTRVEFGKVFPQLMEGNVVKNLSCGFITKKGETIFLEGQALPVFDKGKVIGSQAFLRNVTGRKKAEEQIREQENRFRALVDTAPDATVIADEKGIIRIANRQATKLFGYTKAELTGMQVEALIPQSARPKHEDFRRQYVSNPHTRPMGTGRDLLAVRKDGQIVPVEISLSPYHFAEGILVTASIRDITQRKKAEKELEESYRSVRQLTEHLQNVREEERTHIAREIHDELGQQLTVLMMDVSWLDRKIGAENDAAKKKINELMKLLDNTVKTVRRISTELRPSVLDDLGLSAAIAFHLEEFEKRSGIRIQLAVPKKEPVLTGPVKNGLFRIFQESLTNVARHSGAKKVMVKIEVQSDKIILMIKDDGRGFDEERATGKRTLGVLGMKERTTMMGGEYSISGIPGKGTTVLVNLPLKEQDTKK